MVNQSPKVAVIVLNWNRRDDTLETLHSLSRVTYRSFNVIVVDNGSTDDSADAVRREFPDVTLIETGSNLGFAGGNNAGIRKALADGADAILLLNNDVEVAPDFLGHLVEALYSAPEIGAVNPKIYYYADRDVIWSAGGSIDYRQCITLQRHLNEPDTGQADAPQEIDYAIGCALLVKREVIESVGLMDNDFFVYYEETEWCHRMKKSGFSIRYVPQSRIWHKVSSSMNGKSLLTLYYFCRNRLLFGRKCGFGELHNFRIALFGLGRMAAGYIFRRKYTSGKVVLKAVFDYYTGRFGEARV